MFDFVRRHNRLLQFALVLLIFPSFVLFGVQGYQQFSEKNEAAASVAGRDISRAELDAAFRSQIERMRAQMPGLDVKAFDSPEMRQRVLDELIRERVSMEAARKLILTPTDEQVIQTFQTDPQFAGLRNSDGTVRKELLASRGVSSEQFVQQLKQDLAVRQVFVGIGGSVPSAEKVSQRALSTMFQQRDIQVARFSPKDFVGRVTISDAELQAFYADTANAALFQSREQAQIDYVVLDLDAVTRSIKISDEELRKYYTENVARYTQAEERRARHILVKADKTASAEDKTKARAKAEGLLAELRKSRAGFPEMARTRSDDPGSAAQGGDLDWFGRGAMTKPFEDAAFALKKGELSAVVESDFGFHLIEVTDSRGGDARSFESVRVDIDAEVKKQLAQKRFAEAAEQFTDAVEQDDQLGPIADKLKLEVRKADAVTRLPAAGASGPLAQAKFLEALFAAEVTSGKRNTGAIETGPNQLVAGHVVKYTAAQKQAFADVKELARSQLTARRSAEIARKEGAVKLALWQKSDADAVWSTAAVTVSRAKTGDQPRAVVDAALRASPERMPVHAGVDLGDDGYAIVKVVKIGGADPAVAGDAGKVREQYGQLWAQAESEAYYRALKERFNVKQNKSAVAAVSAGAP